MQYFCKNHECKRIFLAEDLGQWTKPQAWRYCFECESGQYPIIREKPVTEFTKIKIKKMLASKQIKKASETT